MTDEKGKTTVSAMETGEIKDMNLHVIHKNLQVKSTYDFPGDDGVMCYTAKLVYMGGTISLFRKGKPLSVILTEGTIGDAIFKLQATESIEKGKKIVTSYKVVDIVRFAPNKF